MKRNQKAQPYLINHVQYIVSQPRVDKMYIELVKTDLINQMVLIRPSTERETPRVLETALTDLLSYEHRLNDYTVVEKDIRPVRYTSTLDQSSKNTTRGRKTSKVSFIAKIVKKLLDEPQQTRRDQIVEKDIRPVRFVSKTV